jgi:hypothetical protein
MPAGSQCVLACGGQNCLYVYVNHWGPFLFAYELSQDLVGVCEQPLSSASSDEAPSALVSVLLCTLFLRPAFYSASCSASRPGGRGDG